jgi:hypothetical protein
MQASEKLKVDALLVEEFWNEKEASSIREGRRRKDSECITALGQSDRGKK